MPAVRINHGRWRQCIRLDDGNLQQAHIITRATAERLQCLTDLLEQSIRLAIIAKHLQQPLDPEQPVVLVTGIDHAIGQQQQAFAQRQRQDLS
ncbi:hypothetical protein D9M73_171420 [compost metagenome]